MYLLRHGPPNHESPGLILEGGRRIDATTFGEDYDEHFFATDGLTRLQSWLDRHADTAPELPEDVRLGPPVARPSKIVCVGLNYRDHAGESGFTEPNEPVVFFKAPSALCGPNDDLIIPRGSEKTDWEVELAVIIGKRASYVSEAEALDYVAGYALMNDYSERAYQIERGGQWVKGKSADTFAPLGPWLATKDEIPDVHDLRMTLTVNGETKQDSSTASMIFRVPFLVSYLSEFMTLLPGDVISTGTPAGVGLGHTPSQYLKPGDVVELTIAHLGTARQRAVAYKESGAAAPGSISRPNSVE